MHPPVEGVYAFRGAAVRVGVDGSALRAGFSSSLPLSQLFLSYRCPFRPLRVIESRHFGRLNIVCVAYRVH